MLAILTSVLWVLLGMFIWLYVKEKTLREMAEYDAELQKRGVDFWKKAYMESIDVNCKLANRKL